MDIKKHRFYPIKRAAEIMGIQTDDILLSASEGKVELCIFFSGVIEEITFDFNDTTEDSQGTWSDRYKMPYKLKPLNKSDILRLYRENLKRNTTDHKIEITQLKQQENIVRHISDKDLDFKKVENTFIRYGDLFIKTVELTRFMKTNDLSPASGCGFEFIESGIQENRVKNTNDKSIGKTPKFWDDYELMQKAFQILDEEAPKLEAILKAMKAAGYSSGEEVIRTAALDKFRDMSAEHFKFLKEEMLSEIDFLLGVASERRDFESRIFKKIIKNELGINVGGQQLRNEFHKWQKQNRNR